MFAHLGSTIDSMSRCTTPRLLAVATCLVGVAAPATAQTAERARIGAHAPRDVRADRTTPGTRRPNRDAVFGTAALSTVAAAQSAAGLGMLGALIGYVPCLHDYAGTGFAGIGALVGCFANDGFVYGVYAGSFTGAALGAAGGGIRAGCSRRASFARGFLGALAGSLPGIAYAAAGGSDNADVSNAFAVGTPVLQVAGATTAISRCRVRPPR
jgi:hypothetical protein